MFTEEDLRKLCKAKNEYYEKKEEEDRSSSALEDKTEEQLYFCKYFLNESFKIIHIEISATEEVYSSLARIDSYMVYLIKVLTEEFSYELRRRYSEFLKLHDQIASLPSDHNKSLEPEKREQTRLGKLQRHIYTFPTKRLSSSLLHFFNICSKEKLAQDRKSQLCSFLNQIRCNYYKFPDEFSRDYVELLKFIDMKEEHQKFWRRREGRLLEISNVVLRDPNAANQNKANEKPNDSNSQSSVEHLVQLLQHQMNKMNLAIAMKQGLYKSSPNLGAATEASTEVMIADEIIKNVDCIRDIVLEMKRKINYDHIRCILKGKDLKPAANSIAKHKKGLIEFCLKHTVNELVAMHILRIVLDVLINPECNYSCDGFLKVLCELQAGIFALGEEKQSWALQNKDFRQAYFKLIKQYCIAKQQYSADKKGEGSEKAIVEKTMSAHMAKIYQDWDQACLKNKEFKTRDEQKQWTIVIENHPTNYNPKKSSQPCFLSEGNCTKPTNLNQQKDTRQSYSRLSTGISSGTTVKFTKTEENDKLRMTLTTSRVEEHYVYFLSVMTKSLSYKQCLEIMKCQQNWNPLLMNSQTDVYSSTKKDCLRIPGKKDKIFRFTEHEEIQLDLQQQAESSQQPCDNFVSVGNFEQMLENHEKQVNPKSSTQTMPSANGSCAQDFLPDTLQKESVEDLAGSKLSRKTTFMKMPPSSGSFNSYYQQVRVQRGDYNGKLGSQMCSIEIELIFAQPTAYRYFSSELDGSSLFIWQGVQKCLQEATEPF